MDELEIRKGNSICRTVMRTYAMKRSREVSYVL